MTVSVSIFLNAAVIVSILCSSIGTESLILTVYILLGGFDEVGVWGVFTTLHTYFVDGGLNAQSR